jgi:glycosyltransferase involved in cell wall biosynthesis
MSWRDSHLGKVWLSISSYGLRAGIRDAAARWAGKHLSIPQDVYRDYAWILNENRPAALPASPGKSLRINWLVPSVAANSGGLFNIFRAVHELEKWGHQQRIYTVGERTRGGEEARQSIRKNYFPIQSEVEWFNGAVEDSDVLVATSWMTAYAARSVANTAGKFYLIQDLEYLFYPPGSLAEFAKQTYQWNFYGITAGPWIASVLQDEFGMQCSSFTFSYDRSTYSREGSRRLATPRKRVLFYARATSARRGFELGVLALYLVSKQMPEVEFVLVGLPRDSVQMPFPALFLGMLPASDLAALYRSCDVALVLSHTNLSLLPLELMACGCAVVSNSGPNVEWLLTEDVAQIAEPNPTALADAILALLQDELLRSRKAEAGLRLAESTQWTTEIKAIESAFYRGLNVSAPVR